MREVAIEVYGRPAQQGSKRGFVRGGRVILVEDNSKTQKQWYGNVASTAAQVMNGQPLILGPVVLTVKFRFLRPQGHFGTGKNALLLKKSAPVYHTQTPDLSKLVRCTEDALTGVVWADDRQVWRYDDVCRMWTDRLGNEGASIVIKEITPT